VTDFREADSLALHGVAQGGLSLLEAGIA